VYLGWNTQVVYTRSDQEGFLGVGKGVIKNPKTMGLTSGKLHREVVVPFNPFRAELPHQSKTLPLLSLFPNLLRVGYWSSGFTAFS
jgi:hypothetical protein